jgi:hypothetical protein
MAKLIDNVDGIKADTLVTYHGYSNSYPGIVVRVTAKTVKVQLVNYTDEQVFLNQPVGGLITFRRDPMFFGGELPIYVNEVGCLEFGVARFIASTKEIDPSF